MSTVASLIPEQGFETLDFSQGRFFLGALPLFLGALPSFRCPRLFFRCPCLLGLGE